MWIWILLCVPLAIEGKKACPGGTFSCPDTSTCCQTPDKSYGCCPLKNAVCCDDHIHCCPAGHKCSVGMCIQSSNSTLPPTIVINNDVPCPNSNDTCPEDTTCCKQPDTGNYGCCPMEDAVCCNDGYHCCPSGTTCNLEEQKCDGDGYITKLYASHKKYMKPGRFSPQKMAKLRIGGKSVVCPGGEYQCPNGATCCRRPSGDWGCCAYTNADCCKDGLHCCPENMKCDPTSRYCNNGQKNVTSSRNKPAMKIVSNVICPGTGFQCPDGSTCCKLPLGDWGCCPFPNGYCCKDGIHCCPENMKCDATSQYCSQGPNNVTSLRNKPAMKIEKVGGECPDKKTCQDFETCCQIGDVDWGCCPYANATCCADRKHCCPSNNDCDDIGRRCVPRKNFVLEVLDRFGL